MRRLVDWFWWLVGVLVATGMLMVLFVLYVGRDRGER